jgi:signal transduction histidine kinase
MFRKSSQDRIEAAKARADEALNVFKTAEAELRQAAAELREAAEDHLAMVHQHRLRAEHAADVADAHEQAASKIAGIFS